VFEVTSNYARKHLYAGLMRRRGALQGSGLGVEDGDGNGVRRRGLTQQRDDGIHGDEGQAEEEEDGAGVEEGAVAEEEAEVEAEAVAGGGAEARGQGGAAGERHADAAVNAELELDVEMNGNEGRDTGGNGYREGAQGGSAREARTRGGDAAVVLSERMGEMGEEDEAADDSAQEDHLDADAAASSAAVAAAATMAISPEGTFDRGVAIFSPELVLHAQEVWDRMAPQVHAMHAGGGASEKLGKSGKAMSGVYAVVLSAQVCDRVHLYGFSPYSRRSNAPYHYFDDTPAVLKHHSFDLAFEVFTSLSQWPCSGVKLTVHP
jgi:hypothetical protein